MFLDPGLAGGRGGRARNFKALGTESEQCLRESPLLPTRRSQQQHPRKAPGRQAPGQGRPSWERGHAGACSLGATPLRDGGARLCPRCGVEGTAPAKSAQ